jgi:hypothetical protein
MRHFLQRVINQRAGREFDRLEMEFRGRSSARIGGEKLMKKVGIFASPAL